MNGYVLGRDAAQDLDDLWASGRVVDNSPQ
jgi:hypothetical protein